MLKMLDFMMVFDGTGRYFVWIFPSLVCPWQMLPLSWHPLVECEGMFLQSSLQVVYSTFSCLYLQACQKTSQIILH